MLHYTSNMRFLIPIFILCLSQPVLAAEFHPNPRLQAIAPNHALDLGVYECSDGEDRRHSDCATNTDYSGMVYDAQRHRMLLFGGGHAATYRDDVDIFDLRTLNWRSAYPPTPCEDLRLDNVDVTNGRWISSNHPIARHSYDLLAMAGKPSELFLFPPVQGRGRGCQHLPKGKPYVIAEGRVAAYNPDTRQWRYTRQPALGFRYAAETDPVSGLIILVDRTGLQTFDPHTGELTQRLRFHHPDMHWERNLVYYPPLDRFYYFVQGGLDHRGGKSEVLEGVYEITLDRRHWGNSRIQRLEDVAAPGQTANAWAYDAAHQLIGGGPFQGRFYAFDPRTHRWQSRTIQAPDALNVGTVSAYALAFDPIDGVYIFRTDHASGRHTWAYRWGVRSTPE